MFLRDLCPTSYKNSYKDYIYCKTHSDYFTIKFVDKHTLKSKCTSHSILEIIKGLVTELAPPHAQSARSML